MAYIEEEALGSIYGCFRCGKINGDLTEDDDGVYLCGECGERSVLPFRGALDILNDMHLKGALREYEVDPDDDYITVIEPAEEEDNNDNS